MIAHVARWALNEKTECRHWQRGGDLKAGFYHFSIPCLNKASPFSAHCLMRTKFPPFSRFWKTASGAGNQNKEIVSGFFVCP
jgi:hypothetical protein